MTTLAQDARFAGKRQNSLVVPLQHVDWIAVALAVAAFVVYTRTLAPSVLWSDYGEYQYSAYSLSVPHQTGYPLYILLAKLWTLLPVGDVAYRVNLMSAFWGAVTVALTYLCVKQLCGSRRAAAISALTLAFSTAFWTYACIAAIRTLHTAFVALITLLTLGVAQRRVSVEALALAIGLAMTHHRMTIFLLPGVAWALWQTRVQVAWGVRRVINAAVLLVLPQSLYLFVAFGRSWSSPREFWDFVLAANEASVLSKTAGQIAEQFIQKALPTVWNVFTPVGLLIALLGLGALVLSRRDAARQSMGIYLAGGWLLNVAFAGLHFTEDPTHYLTHGFVLQAIALGVGLAAVLGWLERKLPKRVMWVALAFPIAWMAMNWQAADQSGTGWIGAFTLEDLTSVESNSVVASGWSFVMPYRYHQIVQRYRRDLELPDSGDNVAMSQVERDLVNGRPVYLRERSLRKNWKGRFTFVPVGRLWRVLPTEPVFGPPQRVNASFGDTLRLTRIATWPANLTTNQMMLLRLGWELTRPIEHDLSVSTRLVGSDGVTWQHQETPLQDATGILSTTAWLQSPSFPPGDYHWQITVDDHSTGVNLGLADLPTFHISRPDQPVPISSVVVDGHPNAQPGAAGWELMGYGSAPLTAQPGIFVTLPLFWRATRDAASPVEARLELRDRQSGIVAEQNVTLPANARAGDLIESRPGLELPMRLAEGRYELVVVADRAVGLTWLDVRGRERSYRVPPIAHRRQVQVGDHIEWLGYEIGEEKQAGSIEIRPGSKIHLTLIWRATGTPPQSFKVFAHVLSADGKLAAQSDGVPGSWAMPTDTWVDRQVIVDSYSIAIPPETQPGEYRLQIGMYDPESGQRPAASEGGTRLTDDVIVLTTFAIK